MTFGYNTKNEEQGGYRNDCEDEDEAADADNDEDDAAAADAVDFDIDMMMCLFQVRLYSTVTNSSMSLAECIHTKALVSSSLSIDSILTS